MGVYQKGFCQVRRHSVEPVLQNFASESEAGGGPRWRVGLARIAVCGLKEVEKR